MKKTNILEKPFFTGLFIIGMCAVATLIIISSTEGFFKSKSKRPLINPSGCERNHTVTDSVTGKIITHSRMPIIISNTENVFDMLTIKMNYEHGKNYVTISVDALLLEDLSSSALIHLLFTDGIRLTLNNDSNDKELFISQVSLEDEDLYTKSIDIMRLENRSQTVEQKFTTDNSSEFLKYLQCLILKVPE